jgi:hypothetical protein
MICSSLRALIRNGRRLSAAMYHEISSMNADLGMGAPLSGARLDGAPQMVIGDSLKRTLRKSATVGEVLLGNLLESVILSWTAAREVCLRCTVNPIACE